MKNTIQLLALVLSGLVGLSQLANGQDLPKGEEVMSRYAEATGGLEAYEKIENRVVKATITAKGDPRKIPVTSYAARPNLSYTVMEVPGSGTMEQGTNGDVAWSNSVMTGPVVVEDETREQTLRSSVFDRLVFWKKAWVKAECKGIETVGEEECYVVELTPRSFAKKKKEQPEDEGEKEAAKKPKPDVLCFSVESGLLLEMRATMQTVAGPMDVRLEFGDYRKVGDLLQVHRTTRYLAGMELLIEVTSIEQNVELPKDRFALPAEIQKILDRKKQKKDE